MKKRKMSVDAGHELANALYKCVGRSKIEHYNETGMITWISIIDKFLKVGANLRKKSNLLVHLGYYRATQVSQ